MRRRIVESELTDVQVVRMPSERPNARQPMLPMPTITSEPTSVEFEELDRRLTGWRAQLLWPFGEQHTVMSPRQADELKVKHGQVWRLRPAPTAKYTILFRVLERAVVDVRGRPWVLGLVVTHAGVLHERMLVPYVTLDYKVQLPYRDPIGGGIIELDS